MDSRKDILSRLMICDGSLATILESLNKFSWDSEEELVVLRRNAIIAILQRYLKGQLAAADVENWANAIEGREDVGFEFGHEKLIKSVLFELANPTLTRYLSEQRAYSLIDGLA